MNRDEIKNIILDVAGHPTSGWVAENAESLANEIAKRLNKTETKPETSRDISPNISSR